MSNLHSDDPRAIRTRAALQEAFKDLLQTHSLQKINVTDITKLAGFARHTFYNHYDTKEHLLNEIIDSVLSQFLTGFEQSDFTLVGPGEDLRMYTSFFQLWKAG